MNTSDRLVGSRSRESVDLFYQTRLVPESHMEHSPLGSTHSGCWMRRSVVNLLPKFGISEYLVRHGELAW